MWQWLLLLALSLSPIFSHPSLGAPTYVGPASDKEAVILWHEGQMSLGASRYQDAVNALQRYVDRYPGQAHYLKAHLLLGQAYLELGMTQKAIPLLESCVTASKVPLELGLHCRIELAKSYIRLKKFHEAILLITRQTAQQALSIESSLPWISHQLALLQVQALLGLDQEGNALKVWDSKLKRLPMNTPLQITSQASLLHLQLKIKECDHLPSTKPFLVPLHLPVPLNEAQVQNQLERKGTCLLETLLPFQKLLTERDLKTANQGADELSLTFQNYLQLCTSPPASLIQVSNEMSTVQRQKYLAELTDSLIERCRMKTEEALRQLTSWTSTLPASMKTPLTRVTHALEHGLK